MPAKHVPFLERGRIEKKIEPLARGQLAAGVLSVDALLAAAQPAELFEALEFAGLLVDGHRGDYRWGVA